MCKRFWTGVAAGAVLSGLTIMVMRLGHIPTHIGVKMELLERTTNTCIVNVLLENRGSYAYICDGGQAPWEFRSSNVCTALLLDDRERRSRRVIQPSTSSPISLSSPAPVIVQPGCVATNQVYLDLYYEEVLDALLQGDVLLFWLYEPRRTDGSVGPPAVSGCLRIPRLRP